MKLAEALLLRADMQKKLATLRGRIGKNAVVQHGDEPHEDPTQLLDEAFAVLKELERSSAASTKPIYKTSCLTVGR